MKRMVLAIFLMLVLLSCADGKPRPTISTFGDCTSDSTTDKGCDGLICYCCYDDGCWICNGDPTKNLDCVWDPKGRASSVTPIKVGQTQPVSINPGSVQSPTTLPNRTLIHTGSLNIGLEERQNPITPPSIPSIPFGPTTGRPFTSYTYSTSATDPKGYQVKYTFDWGDGTSLSTTSFWVNSGAKASLSHKWTRTGTYLVRAMATNAKGATSPWSNTLSVTISTASAQISKIGNAPEAEQGQGQNNNQNKVINSKIPI
jgi:hypothetical protein